MLEKILESCEYVSQNSRYVKINYDKVNDFIKDLDNLKNTHWLSSNLFGILDLDVETLINYLLVLHTIGDYSFWGSPKWTIKTNDGKILDGTYAMMYVLYNRFKSNCGMNMTIEEFGELLKGDIEIPLLEDRYNNLKVMNEILESKMNNNFYRQIAHFTNDEELFDYIINNFPYFKDESKYYGKTIYLYKRAQLFTSDILQIRRLKENIEVDLKNLVGCADYKIPQVMRTLGILEYSNELSNIVDNEIEVEKDSKYEIEIRANMLTVIDYITHKLNDKYTHMEINDYIWLRGQDKTLFNKPYHRTRTNKY